MESLKWDYFVSFALVILGDKLRFEYLYFHNGFYLDISYFLKQHKRILSCVSTRLNSAVPQEGCLWVINSHKSSNGLSAHFLTIAIAAS